MEGRCPLGPNIYFQLYVQVSPAGGVSAVVCTLMLQMLACSIRSTPCTVSHIYSLCECIRLLFSRADTPAVNQDLQKLQQKSQKDVPLTSDSTSVKLIAAGLFRCPAARCATGKPRRIYMIHCGTSDELRHTGDYVKQRPSAAPCTLNTAFFAVENPATVASGPATHVPCNFSYAASPCTFSCNRMCTSCLCCYSRSCRPLHTCVLIWWLQVWPIPTAAKLHIHPLLPAQILILLHKLGDLLHYLLQQCLSHLRRCHGL